MRCTMARRRDALALVPCPGLRLRGTQGDIAGELALRLCRFAVDEMALSGCAMVLMSRAESASVLAGPGRHAQTVTR
jgi:hypothetical protein